MAENHENDGDRDGNFMLPSTRLTGALATLSIMLMVLAQAGLVIARYFLGIGSFLLQEVVLAMFALAVMFSIAPAWARDGHVRVDIMYARFPAAKKRLVDRLGLLLLLTPACLLMIWSGWPYVVSSWRVLEGSKQVGGLPGVFLVKSLIIAMPVLVLIQAWWQAFRKAGASND